MASDSEEEEKCVDVSVVEAAEAGEAGAMSAAQRQRAQRSRQRALRLRAQRAAEQRQQRDEQRQRESAAAAGGFVREDSASPPRAPVPQPAPLPHASLQPPCDECGTLIATSYLLDQFSLAVCDACRDPERHALVPRSQAKQEFLLQDCDLDMRPPPLRYVTRRNPHRLGGEMRLYVRAAVEARALEVWGGAAGLAEAEERRRTRGEAAAAGRARRRLRELRAAARRDLVTRAPPDKHEHRWGAEEERPDGDYDRRCLDCGLVQTYEKM